MNKKKTTNQLQKPSIFDPEKKKKPKKTVLDQKNPTITCKIFFFCGRKLVNHHYLSFLLAEIVFNQRTKPKLFNYLLKNSYVNMKKNIKNIFVCCSFQVERDFITLRKSMYEFSWKLACVQHLTVMFPQLYHRAF